LATFVTEVNDKLAAALIAAMNKLCRSFTDRLPVSGYYLQSNRSATAEVLPP